MQSLTRAPSSFVEIALIVAIFAGSFIYWSLLAVAAGFPVSSFEDRDALALIRFECAAFLVAAAVLVLFRGWRLDDFGLRITAGGSLAGLLLYGVSLGVIYVLWTLVGTRLPGTEMVDEMTRATTLTFPVLVAFSVVNGAFEEFFLARYLIEAFSRHGACVALGASAAVRLSYHTYQGPWGALAVLAFGLVVTLFYWRYREVWPAMSAHMLADFLALA